MEAVKYLNFPAVKGGPRGGLGHIWSSDCDRPVCLVGAVLVVVVVVVVMVVVVA